MAFDDEKPKPTAPETHEGRLRRLAREGEMIDEAVAELDAGKSISAEAFNAWMTKLIAGEDPPIPGSTAGP